MADKRAYHPDGIRWIEFLEEPHTYTDNRGIQYLSGTSFVGRFFSKFDAKTQAVSCSRGTNPKYAGRPPGDIRAEWEGEGRRGSREGDNTHAYAEARVSGWAPAHTPKPISDRCAALFTQVDRAVAGLIKKYIFIGAEMVIFSPALGLSGMVDLLMYDPATNELLVLDWKQNKDVRRLGFQGETAHPPIDHLQASDISKYGLQLSTYQFILEREKYFPTVSGYRRALIHLTPTNFIPIPLDYYDFEIRVMLETL